MRTQDLVPPVLLPLARRVRDKALRRKPETQWTHSPQGWVASESSPFDSETSRELHSRVWTGWGEALSGPGPLGVDYFRSLRGFEDLGEGVVGRELRWAHNGIMVYAYALALASMNVGLLSILDWGGGVGQFYPLSSALLPEISFDYHVRDVPALTALGQSLNPDVTFWGDDTAWRGVMFDLVICVSALQFVEKWQTLVDDLASASSRYLLLSRIPLVSRHPSFVVTQQTAMGKLPFQFSGWYFNREELTTRVEAHGLKLRREFLVDDDTRAARVPEQASYRALLFERPHRDVDSSL